MNAKTILLILLGSLWIAACSAVAANSAPLNASTSPSDPPASSTNEAAPNLPDLGPAPELNNTVWINTDQPLRLADLRGKVVGLEMWTFGCINCQHVMPSLKEWHERYSEEGFVLIGNHYPEFDYEHDLANLQKAVSDEGIRYAVAQDNDGATWRAYRNRYWPALYLIDKRGHIRYLQIGEGAYEETEKAIQSLLQESYAENTEVQK